MIDTIVLRVHNLLKNNNLIKSLNIAHVNGYDSELATVNQEDLHDLMMKRKKPQEMLKILKWKQKGEFLIKTKVGKQVNTSAHYQFTYFVNYTQDYVEFNFSIPKFKYGSNIMQFIRHNYDTHFVFYQGISLEHNMKATFDMLVSFIRKFFKHEFLFAHIDFKDVEINRIDICFNQVLKSKEDALLYLEYQKRLKKKHARDENGVMTAYATSLMYVTKRYSAKIYHKGTEYEKHDKKEHQKFNEKRRTRYFDTVKYQSFADRILRYEMTFRHTYLNYLHKAKLFRKNCGIWRKMFTAYSLVEASKQTNDRISKAIAKLKSENDKEKYRAAHPYLMPDKMNRETHRMVSKIISKRRFFLLETTMQSDFFNVRTVPYNDDFALFSRQLLDLCMSKFLDFLKEYQVLELPADDAIKNKILSYNEAHPKSHLPVNEMVSFYTHLKKHGSFKDAAKFSNYSRASLFRYIDRFKKIGITDKFIEPAEKTFGIPKAPMDFREYQITVNTNDFLKSIKMTATTYA